MLMKLHRGTVVGCAPRTRFKPLTALQSQAHDIAACALRILRVQLKKVPFRLETTSSPVTMRATPVFVQCLMSRMAILLVCIAAAAPLCATARPLSEAGAIIQSTIEQLRTAIRREINTSNRADPAKISALVDELVLPHLDITLSGRLILGRHWGNATATERRDFIEGYRALLLRVYAVHAADYMDAEVKILDSAVTAAEGRGSAPKNLTVRTRVTRPGKPVASVDYRMAAADGTWKIFDAVINGVSIVSMLRTAVSEEIGRSGGLSEFNKKLARHPP